ncbi:MAG: hypothetical protein RL148_2669 [Planctomycetota bacterium]
MAAVAPGTVVTTRIDALGYGGAGIGRHGSRMLRVPKALPGELVRAEVVRDRGRRLDAALLEVLEPAAERVQAPCAHFARCGGCTLMHLSPVQQREDKFAKLRERLVRAFGHSVAALLRPVVPSPTDVRFRNRSAFVVRNGDLGMVDPARRTLAPVDTCLVAEPAVDALLVRMQEWLSGVGRGNAALVHGVMFRTGTTHDMAILTVDPAVGLPTEPAALAPLVPGWLAELAQALGTASVWACTRAADDRSLLGRGLVHLHGPLRIQQSLGPFTLDLSPTSFAQSNPGLAARLYADVVASLALQPQERVLDLFSGSGGLGLHLGAAGNPVHGVELDRFAAADATASALAHGMAHVRFLAGKAERAADKLWRRQQRFDVATLNPPRSGMPRDLAPRLAPLGIRRVALVSCSPATLVNDLAALQSNGYRATAITPYDMFPHTSHLETHVALERAAT